MVLDDVIRSVAGNDPSDYWPSVDDGFLARPLTKAKRMHRAPAVSPA
jgi:hypothetical protein